MKDFFVGLLQAVGVLLVLLLILALGGCATGVQMSDEEAIACRSEGCGVFTEGELRALVDRAVGAGYRKGWTDAVRQSGANL